MKQIALVLFLTAMAAVGFVVTQKLTRPDSAQNAPTRNLPAATGGLRAPTTQRPSVGEQELILPDELIAEQARRASFDWKAVADPGSVVRVDRAWDFDLSEVDFDAETPLTVGGVPVSRERLRAFTMLDVAAPLLDARMHRELALYRAAARGVEIDLAPSELQRIYDMTAASKGLSRDQFTAQLANMTGLSMAVSAALREEAFVGTLAQVIGLDGVENLPSAFQRTLPIGDGANVVEVALGAINEAWAERRAQLDAGEQVSDEVLAKIMGGLDAVSLFGMNAVSEELSFRAWTLLDDPEAAANFVCGLTFDPIDDSSVGAPWLTTGPRAEVNTEDLWEVVSQGINRATLENSTANYLFYTALHADLEQRGIALTPTEAWAAYLEEYNKNRGTAFGMDFLYRKLEGYPTLHHYRNMAALQQGFERSLPAGWDSESEQASFFERNRFFIEGWQPSLTITVFPAVDPRDLTGAADWAASFEAASSARARILAGEDFQAVAQDQNRELLEGVREAMGDSAAEGLESQLGPGGTGFRGLTQIDELFGLKHYNRLLHGTSMANSAAAHLTEGEVSEPWKTPLGYVLVRVDGARLGELESEYEDEVFNTQFFYRTSKFGGWVNEVLNGIEVR